MRLNQLPTHFSHSDWSMFKTFWTHQPLLQVSKNVDFSFYFLRTGRKRSHSVPSEDYTTDDSSNRCFKFSKMQLFEPIALSCWRVIRLRRLVFLTSWETTSKQMVVNPRFITCHDVIDVFRSTAIVVLEHFFRPIDTILFWAIDKLCGIQCEQIFFTVKCSCNIECMYAGPTNEA